MTKAEFKSELDTLTQELIHDQYVFERRKHEYCEMTSKNDFARTSEGQFICEDIARLTKEIEILKFANKKLLGGIAND